MLTISNPSTWDARWRAYGLWVAGVVLALVLTQYDQACKPPPLFVGGLCGLILIGVLVGRPWLVALASLLPFVRWVVVGGVPNAHDIYTHAWNLWAMGRALVHGDWFPSWFDAVGLGQPTPIFYAPIPYGLGGLLVALGVPVRVALLLLAWLASIAGAFGVWWVLRRWQLSRLAIACATLAFLVAPYRLLDINYRYAVAELFGLACMLPFWESLRWLLSEPGELRAKRALWVTGALLIMSHPLSALMAATVSLLLIAQRMRRDGRARPLVAVAVVAVVTLASVAFYVLPAAVHANDARLASQLPSTSQQYRGKALRPGQAFVRERWDGRRISYTVKQEAARLAENKSIQEVPFYLGIALVLPILFVSFRGGTGPGRIFAAIAILSWLFTLLWPATVMGRWPVFYPLQFPWRFLGPATIASVAVFAVWLDALPLRAPHAALVAMLLLADAWPGFGAGSWTDWPSDAGLRYHVAAPNAQACETRTVGPQSRPLPSIPPQHTPRLIEIASQPSVVLRGPSWAGYPHGDILMRTWGMRLPPQHVGESIASVHRVPPEYFTSDLVHHLLRPIADDPAARRALGVRVLLDRSHGVQFVDSWPYILLSHNGQLFGMGAAVRRPRPSQIEIELPADHPGGQLIVLEQSFPGWMARGDEGWGPAGSWKGLLSTAVQPAQRQVEFALRATTAQCLGRAVSLLALGCALWLWWRRR